MGCGSGFLSIGEKMEEFYLISTELRTPYEPRACRILKRLRSTIRDDLAHVTIDPPISKEIYNTKDDITELILGSRLEGSTLFPISEWPTSVYICRLKNHAISPFPEIIDAANLVIMDWGEIHRLREDAIKALAG